MTEFFMPMIPPTATAQEHKVMKQKDRIIFYDPPNVKDARAKLTANLARHRPPKRYTCGIRLITKWLFPNDGKHKDGEYKTDKPDTDNLQKMFKDCMTRLDFWTDDELVASEICEKFWADTPGIYVRIEEL